jgi:ankyrin repeat protein
MSVTQKQALFDAIRGGKLADVEAALAAGADINAKETFSFAIDRDRYDGSHTALLLAAKLPNEASALRLLDVPGIEVDAADDFAGETPLMQAARQGLATLVDRLLAMGADPNAEEKYDRSIAARYAIRARHGAIALTLIDAGTDLGRFGAGLLGDAAWYDRRDVLEALLARGVSPDAKDETGRTARYMASWGKKQWALDRFAATQPDGPKPADLFAAASRGDVAAIRHALDFGVPYDVRREDGATALLLAAEAGQMQSVEALMAERADPNLTDATGRSALGIARARGDNAMLELIDLWTPK